jgi:hypothetical protein
LPWKGEHPRKNHLAVNKLKDGKIRIPLLSYRDFIDTKAFDGDDLFLCNVPEQKEKRHHMMEEYSKKNCLAFVPFRKLDELQIHDSYHLKLKQYFGEGRFDKRHMEILQNIQDCRNSLNAGCPKDLLERCTETPRMILT